MKYLISVFALLASIQAQASNRALVVGMFGDAQSVDLVAYKKVLKIASGLVEENMLDKYIVRGFGREGGSEFCIQLNSFQPESIIDKIYDQFVSIKTLPTTSYYVIQSPICPNEEGEKQAIK